MPWSPPIMLVSIVGHASFHTAGPSGPSIMDRSYFRRSGTAAGVSESLTRGFTTGAETSVMLIGLDVVSCHTHLSNDSQSIRQLKPISFRESDASHTVLLATDAPAYPHLGRIPDFGENFSVGSTRRFEDVEAVICSFDPMHLPVCLHSFQNCFHQVWSAERIASAIEA